MSSEMKVRTNNQDQLKKLLVIREKMSKSASLHASLAYSSQNMHAT
jgi:hypothetical protein